MILRLTKIVVWIVVWTSLVILAAWYVARPTIAIHYAADASQPVSYFYNAEHSITRDHLNPGQSVRFSTPMFPGKDFWVIVSTPFVNDEGVEIAPLQPGRCLYRCASPLPGRKASRLPGPVLSCIYEERCPGLWQSPETRGKRGKTSEKPIIRLAQAACLTTASGRPSAKPPPSFTDGRVRARNTSTAATSEAADKAYRPPSMEPVFCSR